MADTKEIIEIEYIVKADQAIAKAEEFRARVNETKAQLKQFAAESGQSLQDLAKGMVKAFGAERLAEIQKLRAGLAEKLKTEVAPEKQAAIKADVREQIKQQTAAYREYSTVVRTSLSEITAAEKVALNERKASAKELAAQQKASLKEAELAQKEYIAAWRRGTPIISQAAQEYGARIQQLKTQIQDLAKTQNLSFTQVGKNLVAQGKANIQDTNQALKELTSTGTGLAGVFSKLGAAGSFFFGSVLGLTAITALRSVINLFKELVTAGFEYAKALVRLNISTNILQQKGYNITLRETYQLVADLNREFPIFTRKAIVEGVGYIQLLSQNLELTNEQMKNMAGVASGLAVILGKDVNDAARELALFLSSGYGEALQRAGILASKAAVMHELLRMGIREGYNEVSAAMRAQAGYNVIMRDASLLLEKAKEVQEGDAYAVDRLKQAWGDFTSELGRRTVPTIAYLIDGILAGAGVVKDASDAVGKLRVMLEGFAFSTAPVVARSFQLIRDSMENAISEGQNFDELMTKYKEDIKKIYDAAVEARAKATYVIPDIGKDFPIGAGSALEEETEKIAEVIAALYTAIHDLGEDFRKRDRDAWRDYRRDIEQLGIDAKRDIDESWMDYYADAYEIARRMNDDFIKEDIDYQAKLVKAQREFALQREDIDTKYRDRELKDERDFQEKMRRLREDFIMDLEDALRERDARQVLRLIRQFNLDRTRLERERDAQREDRQREYRREIEALEQQRQEKLRVLYEEHQARYAEIKRQEAIELRELEIKHRAELAEIDRRLAQEKEDRKVRWQQQQADLKQQFKERIDEIGEGLAKEYSLTKEILDKIAAEYIYLYGEDGVMQQTLDAALRYLEAFYTQYSQMMGGLYPGPTPWKNLPKNKPAPYNPLPGSNRALGATDMLVTSPKIIQVGEVPELINITPLNRIGSSGMGGVGEKGGTITLDVWLSPDLEARVRDSTLNDVADIMLDIQRRR